MTDAETVRQWLDLDAPQEAHEALGRLAGRHQRRRRSMTDHANTIRNGLLPRDAHHKFCNTRRDIGRDCDCYYSLRRDGKVAHDALDALLAGHAAEVERFSSELRRFKGLADEQHAKYIEARADAETLRQENDRLRQYAWHKRTCSGLWPDGDRRSTPCDCGFDPALDAAQEIHPDDLDWEHAEVREGVTMGEQEPPAERCNEEIRAMGEFAAACSFPKGHDGKHSWHASRPEPPAECRHTNWRVEFRSPARGQVRPDPITYGQWVVCIDCGHERRGSVPPAKGGDRDE